MYNETNFTHNAATKSWVDSANNPSTDFPIQNLPFCQFYETGSETTSVGVAIGDYVLNLNKCALDGFFAELISSEGVEEMGLMVEDFTPLKENGERFTTVFREIIFELLSDNVDDATIAKLRNNLVPINECKFSLPLFAGDYTDFYCSIFHATNVGKLFRPDNPLMPNYKWIPIGYHGRASSIVVSGTDFRRPKGQNHSEADKPPIFIPSNALDYEMEVGFYIGNGNELGETISIEDA
ncbi:MAG: fumarylacetoacetase, partial [Pyrinomonadaceae bacterium]